MKGKVIQLPSGLCVVPYEDLGRSWNCVLVASMDKRYHVGGYNLSISTAELMTGDEMVVNPKVDKS